MSHRIGVALAAVALLFAVNTAAPAADKDSTAARSNIGGVSTDLPKEENIRKLYDEFEAAWNRHDIDGLAEKWAIDGDHMEPDGRSARGQQELRALFTKQHESVFKETVLDLNVESVWFITGGVALVDGTYAIAGVRDPDGNVIPPRKGNLTAVLLLEKGEWWIAASRLMIPAGLPWRPKE